MAIKPTKQQLEQARLRAASSGIPMNQSAKGLRNAGKAIITIAALSPAGRPIKAASVAAKVATKVAVKKAAVKKANKVVNKYIISEATNITKQAAREKEIIAKMHRDMPKAKAKAQKIMDKAVKKNPNLYKKPLG
jgi:hypothetical protein